MRINIKTESPYVVIEDINTNPNCRYFHSKATIAVGYCIWDRHSGYMFNPDVNNYPDVINELITIEGIEHLLLSSAYSLMISKGHAWEWSEIEDKIVTILHNHAKSSFEL